jgi:hypothetical protein
MAIVAAVAILYVAVGLAYWLWVAYAAVRLRRDVPHLNNLQAPDPAVWPRVSVVVPACNEADKIEAAARTLLAQDYPDLEVVLVDDRSTDSTGAVIERLAADDGRVRPIRLAHLPDGWIGKVHALARGLEASRGQVVLFTDADVHFRPAALRKAVAWFEARGLDHLAAFPRLWPTTPVLDALIASFLVQELIPAARPWAVADPRSSAFMGIGAFNLVRRAALEAAGGLEPLRLEVADDLGVGLLVKGSGGRSAVVSGGGLIEMHWYRSLGEAARGAEKAFATIGRCRAWRTALFGVLMAILGLAPLLAPLALFVDGLRPLGCVGLATMAAFLLASILISRWAGASALPALAIPLVAPLSAMVVLRAAVVGWRRGGLVWRGTLYRSEALLESQRVRVGQFLMGGRVAAGGCGAAAGDEAARPGTGGPPAATGEESRR